MLIARAALANPNGGHFAYGSVLPEEARSWPGFEKALAIGMIVEADESGRELPKPESVVAPPQPEAPSQPEAVRAVEEPAAAPSESPKATEPVAEDEASKSSEPAPASSGKARRGWKRGQ